MAWKAYAEAERIFEDPRNWAWLGLIYQEQAICLFQAVRDGGIETLAGTGRDRRGQTADLPLALNLRRDLAIRGYPSALNRAGRIFGQDDIEAGLKYLAEGIDSARQLSDGWFWFANLIEHVELSYRAWEETGRQAYLDLIVNRGPQIAQASEQFEFPDPRGRWKILQGYLRIGEGGGSPGGHQLAGCGPGVLLLSASPRSRSNTWGHLARQLSQACSGSSPQ